MVRRDAAMGRINVVNLYLSLPFAQPARPPAGDRIRCRGHDTPLGPWLPVVRKKVYDVVPSLHDGDL